MSEQRKLDWLKFRIRFLCGALLGAVGGFMAWSRSGYASSVSMGPALAFIGGGALLAGLLAGVESQRGDHFWHSLGEWLRWW